MCDCEERGTFWPAREPEPSFMAAFAAMQAGALVARGDGSIKRMLIGDYGRRFTNGNGETVVLTPADIAAGDWTVVERAAQEVA